MISTSYVKCRKHAQNIMIFSKINQAQIYNKPYTIQLKVENYFIFKIKIITFINHLQMY